MNFRTLSLAFASVIAIALASESAAQIDATIVTRGAHVAIQLDTAEVLLSP